MPVMYLFSELFPEKLAVAVSLTSTYNYGNKRLTRTSPFHTCNNQLLLMQNAVCTNIFLCPTVA